MTNSTTAYRFIGLEDWRLVDQSIGTVPYADVDKKDGYFHMSTAQQAHTTASKHFNGVPLIKLLQIDLNTLDQSKLHWETVNTRNNELFPHYYDNINIFQHVKQIYDIQVDDQGNHIFPDNM